MNDLHENTLDPALTEAEHADYAAQLLVLMQKARIGTIQFGERGEGRVIRNLIVELKPILQQRPAFGRNPRLLRLYLAEPDITPQSLLALRLATKEASERGLSEQDYDIDLAIARVNAWAQAS